MKQKVLLTILLASCFQVVKAQTEFAPIGATWYYSYADNEKHNPLYSYVKYESLSDTIVGGHNCRLVASNSDTLFFYSENGKVYNYYKNHFLLTYDFSVSEGDTVSFDLRGYYDNFSIDTFYTVQGVVESVELIGNNNISRYSIKLALNGELENEVSSPYYFYTEKIGQEYRFISGLEYPSPGMDFGECKLRCYEDFSIHYISDWWAYYDYDCDYQSSSSIESKKSEGIMQLTPNPFSNTTEIKYYVPENAENAVLYVFSLQCNMLLTKTISQMGNGSIEISASELQPGMYICTLTVDGQDIDTNRMIITTE